MLPLLLVPVVLAGSLNATAAGTDAQQDYVRVQYGITKSVLRAIIYEHVTSVSAGGCKGCGNEAWAAWSNTAGVLCPRRDDHGVRIPRLQDDVLFRIV
jgi:hypothetical protein